MTHLDAEGDPISVGNLVWAERWEYVVYALLPNNRIETRDSHGSTITFPANVCVVLDDRPFESFVNLMDFDDDPNT